MELHAFKHTAPDHGVGLLSQPRHIWKQSHLINKNNGYELRAVLQSVAQSEAALQQHFLHCVWRRAPQPALPAQHLMIWVFPAGTGRHHAWG